MSKADTFGHVANTALRAYLNQESGGMTQNEALDYSEDCLEADIRADESGMESAPPIKVLNARESAFDAAKRAYKGQDNDGVLRELRRMWSV